jgi:hypothetical protein
MKETKQKNEKQKQKQPWEIVSEQFKMVEESIKKILKETTK